MLQVRSCVFETNSSNTHSLTICTQEEFDQWIKGELMFDSWSDCFAEYKELTKEEKEDAKNNYNVKKQTYWKDWGQLSEEEIKSWYAKYQVECLKRRNHFGLQTYNDWLKSDSLDRFEHHFTSPSGDEMIAFGKYGYG